jgi:hypothetical protein
LRRLHDRLRDQARIATGRDPRPTAAVIDSRSVKAADTVPKASRGWHNAKKDGGRKRQIAVDATGLLLTVVITAASVQDRNAPGRCYGTCPAAAPASGWPGATPDIPHASLDNRAPPLRPAATNGCPKATKPWSCGPRSPS